MRFDGSGNIQKKKKNENCSFLPIRILKLRVGVLNKNKLDWKKRKKGTVQSLSLLWNCGLKYNSLVNLLFLFC